MIELISIDVIKNDDGGHKDIIFSVPDLIIDGVFDTYYFGIFIEPIESFQDIRNAIAELINFWKTKILACEIGEVVYLPIDFSDQYTGCLKVEKLGEEIKLNYGYSLREGYSVNPISPEDYYKEIDDFKLTSEETLIVSQNRFTSDLEKNIIKLTTSHHS